MDNHVDFGPSLVAWSLECVWLFKKCIDSPSLFCLLPLPLPPPTQTWRRWRSDWRTATTWPRSSSSPTCSASSPTAASTALPTASTASVPTPWRSSSTSSSRRVGSSRNEEESPEADLGSGVNSHQSLKRDQWAAAQEHCAWPWHHFSHMLANTSVLLLNSVTYTCRSPSGWRTHTRAHTQTEA